MAYLQAAFLDNWMETSGEVFHGKEYFPPLENPGSHPAQLFKSSADGGSESVRRCISSASPRRNAACAWRTPTSCRTAGGATLVEAQRRGATVQIIVPGR